MNLCVFFLILIMSFEMVACIYRDELNNKQILMMLKRRLGSNEDIIETPKDVEQLPEAEPIVPGHTLIRPTSEMFKSAVKYPQADLNTLVYGNLNNLGITYGKTNERVLYTGFRKSNELLFLVEARPLEQNNNQLESLIYSNDKPDFRRRRKRSKSKHRKRGKYYKSSSVSTEEDTDSSSSEQENNPGNPYTIHKNRYKQNWMWNHVMTGDHMNVNPFAPKFGTIGPTGAELLFGRKWWYYNQDDFKPFR